MTRAASSRGRERLHDIIVGAHFEPDDAVGLLAPAVSRITGNVAGRADMAAQAEAVLARHHDVEDDEVDRIGGHPRARALGVAGLGDAKALLGQILRERLADRALVIDQQDVGKALGHDATQQSPAVKRRAGRARRGSPPGQGDDRLWFGERGGCRRRAPVHRSPRMPIASRASGARPDRSCRPCWRRGGRSGAWPARGTRRAVIAPSPLVSVRLIIRPPRPSPPSGRCVLGDLAVLVGVEPREALRRHRRDILAA